MRDIAPILVRNCIACHNQKKSESKYVMTTFAQLAKGGKQGEGITLAAGKPDDSYFLDVVLPDADPRMPYKLDPLPDAEIALLGRWIAEGARVRRHEPQGGLDLPAQENPDGHHSRRISRDHAHHGACIHSGRPEHSRVGVS